MPILKNSRYENFAVNVVKGMSRKQAAIQAGYSPRTSELTGFRLIRNDIVLDRVIELQKEIASEAVMSVKERKERLSDFGREDIISSKGTVLRHGNISAISELNKMEKIYSEGSVVIDARTLTINVGTDKAKELTKRLTEGERTEKDEGKAV